MTIMAVEGSLSLTVVDKAEGIVVVFGGEAEGVIGGEDIVRDCGGGDGAGNGAKGCIIVVCCNAITLFKVHHLRHILIAIAGVEKFVTRATLSEKRPRRHGFGWVPDKEVYLRVVVSKAMVFSHAKPLRQFCL